MDGTRAGHVAIIVNPFKETLSSRDVATRCESAARSLGLRTRVLPASDGGDGLLDGLAAASRLVRTSHHSVPGPLGAPVDASIGWMDARTAVVESSQIVGLGLVPLARRDPGSTSTVGLGELLLHVAADGASTVFVGLGGSATMDGGLGMASAWGWRALDAGGRVLSPVGASLMSVARIVRGTSPAAQFVAVADVRNQLLGETGAQVYAEQKGATPTRARRLAEGLDRLVAAMPWDGATGAAASPGAGAAGGLGFGILAFASGQIQTGAEWFLGHCGVDDVLAGASLLVTAEGAFDRTSLEGKLTGHLIALARERRIPCLLLAPTAKEVPEGVIVECGGGHWSGDDLERCAGTGIRRALRLPPQ